MHLFQQWEEIKMKKLLTILFLIPLIVFGRINISPITEGGQTATSIDLRVINYQGGGDCEIYYGFFNAEGRLIPGAEGNMELTSVISTNVLGFLTGTVGAVDSWILSIAPVYDNRYKFYYIQGGETKFIQLSEIILTSFEYNEIREQVFTALGLSYATVTPATVVDDGYYNGFPFPIMLSNGTIVSIYKKSTDHAGKGPMTFASSFDGGDTWSEFQIVVGTTAIECAALSVGLLPSGRICIAYQDDELYTSIKFAYSDDEGATWVYAGSLSFGAGYSSSPSPVKMIVMPSGKIRMGYYKFGLGANPAIIGFIVSTNNGASWSFGETIFSHNGTGLGDEKGHEFAFGITDNTGTDGTCKMIALVRRDVGSTYLHYYSADGGATWQTDFTEDPGVGGPFSRHYLYAFAVPSQQPVDIAIKDGYTWVLCGNRNLSVALRLQWIRATNADSYTNIFSNWSSVTNVLTFNATTMGSDIDCGYPVHFIDNTNRLFVHYYDVSPLPNSPPPTVTDRVWIRQVKIAD